MWTIRQLLFTVCSVIAAHFVWFSSAAACAPRYIESSPPLRVAQVLVEKPDLGPTQIQRVWVRDPDLMTGLIARSSAVYWVQAYAFARTSVGQSIQYNGNLEGVLDQSPGRYHFRVLKTLSGSAQSEITLNSNASWLAASPSWEDLKFYRIPCVGSTYSLSFAFFRSYVLAFNKVGALSEVWEFDTPMSEQALFGQSVREIELAEWGEKSLPGPQVP